MLAGWFGWGADEACPQEAIARSLGLFAGIPADSHGDGLSAFFQLDGPRPKRQRRGWLPDRCGPGWTVLFHGAFDNRNEIADALGLAAGPQARSKARVYGEAVLRWGDAADARITGSYCSLIDTGADRRAVRLARSPWGSPPLAYAWARERLIVASVLRALVAGGIPRELDRARMAEMVFGAVERHDDRGWYKGVRIVPSGAVVWATPEGVKIDQWYGAHSIRPVRLRSDDEYLEAANAELAAAVRATLAECDRPGISLSGGLDSAIVGDEVMRQLGPERTLPSFTWTTLPEWDGSVMPANYAHERPLVEAYAALHPTLRPQFFDNRDTRFHDEIEALSAAAGRFLHLAHLTAPIHAAWRGAKAAGCDLLIGADLGNASISADGTWGFTEYLRTCRLGELYRALRDRPGDERPLLRRFIAMSLLPHLPAQVRMAARRLVHGSGHEIGEAARLLRADFVAREGLDRFRFTQDGRDPFERPRSSAEHVAMWLADDQLDSGEMQQAFEQVHGIRKRDVTAYRPLMELCLGMPTDQFMRGGVHRWLARRMAKGRLPEAQRMNLRYGRWNADWHMRLSPLVGQMREEVDRLAEHPWLGEWFDTERMAALLDDWPETVGPEVTRYTPLEYAMPLALNAQRFANWFDGRNG